MTVSKDVWTDVTVSFRRSDGHLVCAYVSATGGRRGETIGLLDSRHLTSRDESLVDLALQTVREMVLEHALSPVEPF